MNNELRPLGKIMDIVGTLSLDVTYAYDDLVFIEHNAFMLRFDKNIANKVYLHFNIDCPLTDAKKIETSLMTSAKQEGVELIPDNNFNLISDNERKELKIEFKADF